MTTDDYVKRLVDGAPPLTNAQKDRLAVLIHDRTNVEDAAAFEAAIHRQRERREQAERAVKRQEQEARERAEEARREAAKRCALYRHFDSNGTLLYVGVSINTPMRRVQHMQKAKWLRFQATETVEWLPDRVTAEQAELKAISEEDPVFNIRNASAGARERRLKYLVGQEAWDLITEAASYEPPDHQLRLTD